MIRRSQCAAVAVGLAAILVVSQTSWAQNRGGRGRFFGTPSALSLAQLDTVQKELKLTEEQKQTVSKLNDELGTKRRELFQNANGDFAKVRAEGEKLEDEYNQKFNAALDEAQRKRVMEIYVQVGGPSTLLDEQVAKQLELSDEQKQKLQQANEETFSKIREAFRDGQDLSREERIAKFRELNESREKELLAVLTDAQKKQFEQLKGEKIDIDLSQLRGGRRGDD